MYPHGLHVGSLSLSVWNTVFVLAVLVACAVFRRSLTLSDLELRFATVRYFLFVYLSALAAQAFAYAFDANTLVTPPPEMSAWRWYLDPLVGPKTLYGVVVLAPFSVAVATVGSRVTLGRGLDLWTPAILVVLVIVRVGCLLQGCCYGMRTDWFGISFPAGSPVYLQQVREGLIQAGASSLPVVPTQALEAAFLASLAVWSIRNENRLASGRLFFGAFMAYSVFRFGIEFARADLGRGIYAGLATSQWIALAILLGGLGWAARATAPALSGGRSGAGAPKVPF